jgi:uncharacterized cupin superfamily protein
MSHIRRMSTAPVGLLTDPVAPEKVTRGAPHTGYRSTHHDDSRGFYVGIWESDVGAWRIEYDEEELCVILAGRVRLVHDDGTVEEFGPGEAFFIPRGFQGTWDTVEPVRKIYAILS